MCPALHLRRQAYALPLAEAHGLLLQTHTRYARVLLRCPHAEAQDNTLAPSCALASVGVTAPTEHSLMPTTLKGRHKNSRTGTLALTPTPKRRATLMPLWCSRTPSSPAHVLTLTAQVWTGKGIEPQTLAPCGRTAYHQAAA